MLFPVDGAFATWGIAGLATAGVIARPFRWPEAIWAVAGALALVAFGLLPWADAVTGVRKGLDVYLFLAGMMLIAEAARQEGVFDWAAALAVEHARGSPQRLFALVYAVGTVVTVFLSNDATAVVLTPAVYAATRAAGATPLPYLFVCAFIANAASFVLPISNPANLVIFGGHMPHLAAWLKQFGVPSIVSIAVTYLALRMIQRGPLAHEKIAQAFSRPPTCSRRTLDPMGHWRRCRRAVVLFGFGCAAWIADVCLWRRHDRNCARCSIVNHLCRSSKEFRGGCCHWSRACSCWWKHCTTRASLLP